MMLTTTLLTSVLLIGPVQAARPDTRLADAAMQGDRTVVLSLLKQGADVNTPQGDGSTALHWAAQRGDVEMTLALLKAGANLKAGTRIGSMTPLYMAARAGNAAIVEALLEAGADARQANENGTTPLMVAASSGSADTVRALIAGGADVNATDKTNGQTALMFAAALNRAASIKALMESKADANVTTKVFSLAKVQADENGNPLPPQAETPAPAAGAQPRPQGAGGPPRDRQLGASMVGGLAALHFAAREGQMDAIRELVAGGADVNRVAASDKTSPITTALVNGHLDIAKYLLDHGADPNLANTDGLTPLYATIDIRWRANAWYPQPDIGEQKTNYLELMGALIDRGANINARLGRKLWYRRFRYGDDWVDPNGATAFWRAAQANDLTGMRFLISRGADPSIATMRNVSPLMVAAGVGFEYQLTHISPESRLPAVQYLVDELKAEVNAKDIQHYTTLHGAAYVGDNKVIQYLVGKGANPKARARGRMGGTQGAEDVPEGTGDTVADMANGPREKSLLHPETVKLLESLGSENSHDCRSTACVNNTKPDKTPPKQ